VVTIGQRAGVRFIFRWNVSRAAAPTPARTSVDGSDTAATATDGPRMKPSATSKSLPRIRKSCTSGASGLRKLNSADWPGGRSRTGAEVSQAIDVSPGV
jgi:hypothetical protein